MPRAPPQPRVPSSTRLLTSPSANVRGFENQSRHKRNALSSIRIFFHLETFYNLKILGESWKCDIFLSNLWQLLRLNLRKGFFFRWYIFIPPCSRVVLRSQRSYIFFPIFYYELVASICEKGLYCRRRKYLDSHLKCTLSVGSLSVLLRKNSSSGLHINLKETIFFRDYFDSKTWPAQLMLISIVKRRKQIFFLFWNWQTWRFMLGIIMSMYCVGFPPPHRIWSDYEPNHIRDHLIRLPATYPRHPEGGGIGNVVMETNTVFSSQT